MHRVNQTVPPSKKQKAIPKENACTKCGKWKRPQFDTCYTCKFPPKTGAVAPSEEEAKPPLPPPAPKAMTQEEKEHQLLSAFDTNAAFGPRLNTKRSRRYERTYKLGLIDDPALYDLIKRTEHLYEFNQHGALTKKQKA